MTDAGTPPALRRRRGGASTPPPQPPAEPPPDDDHESTPASVGGSDEVADDATATDRAPATDAALEPASEAAHVDAPPPPWPGAGSRAQRRRAEQRATWGRRLSAVLGAVLGVAVVLALFLVVGPRLVDTVTGWFADDEPLVTVDDDAAEGDATGALGVGRRTVLVATMAEGGADSVTHIQLLTVDGDDGTTAMVLVPPSIVTDVPGYGLIPLSDAGGLGGAPLLELTLENTLDIGIDATVRMTRSAWSALFARTGGFEVTVREAIDATTGEATTRRFEAGAQFLDGPRLAELLTVEVPGESEIAALPRAQDVIGGFLATTAGDLDAVYEDDAPMLDTTQPAVVEDVMRALGAAAADDRLDVRTLPVEPVGAGDDVVYRVEARGLELAADVLGSGEVVEGRADGVRLEVLNGNGRVGVGEEVGQRLVPLGHTIVITGNAESFDQDETLVTVRRDDEEVLAAAREIVDALGVGRVTISGIPSTTVDITIVVGADWQG